MPYNSFEHKIKTKLDDAKVQPTPGLWDKISEQLESDQTDYRPALVLPFFMRKEHAPYSLSAAAVVSLVVAIGLQFSQPQAEVTMIPYAQAEAKVIEVETPQTATVVESTPYLYVDEEFNSQAPLETPALASAVVNQENGNESQEISSFDIQTISTIASPPISVPEVNLQYAAPQTAYHRIVPVSKSQKRRFKPQFQWGLTAMSALQLNPLSSSLSAPEFETNAVGISDLYSDFYYPGGIASTRAEIEMKLNDKWGVSAGLGYTSSFEAMGSPSNQNSTRTTSSPLNNGGNNGVVQDFSSLSPTSNINRLDFQAIDISLVMNYYLKRGKGQIAFSTGMLYRHLLTEEPAFLLETIDYATNAQSSVRYVETKDFSLSDLFYLIGRIQYQMQINESLAFHAGPSFQVGLGSAFSYQQFDSKQPLSVGLEVGLRFFPKG